MAAKEIVEEMEKGRLSLDTVIRIQPDAEPRPLYRYIRELVWEEYQVEGKEESVDLADSRLHKVAFEHAPVAMVVSDLPGRITDCNQAFLQLLGYTREEAIGLRISKVAADEDRSGEIALGNELFAGRRRSFQLERKYRKKDGSIVQALLSVSLVRDAKGAPERVIGQFVDLSEQKKLEQELSRGERLQTVGRMVGGVAHDFNNLLTIIEAEIGTLAAGSEDERREALSNLREATSLSSRLTQQLMVFSKEGAVSVSTLDINEVVESLQPILKAALTGRARLILHTPPHVRFPVRANLVLLEQVVMNLVFNGRNAIEDPSGTITVRTYAIGDDKVGLVVEDNGCGMSEEVMARAFEPFFTTREGGGGTGLGLATVYGIITRFGGTITIESEVGVGTSIRMVFPRGAMEELPPPNAISSSRLSAISDADLPQMNRKRILLVDDQATILRILTRLFRKEGWQVVTAGSVSDGILAVSGAEKPYDILLCDLRLPDGHGTTIAQALRERWKGTPVLFMSGFSDGSVDQDAILSGKVEFISKPFVPKDLMSKMRTMWGE